MVKKLDVNEFANDNVDNFWDKKLWIHHLTDKKRPIQVFINPKYACPQSHHTP